MYPTNCWGCGHPIHVLQCTCGSVVLFDYPRPPWQEHECHSGIGGSGYSGWQAADVLRSMGFAVVDNVLDKIFPKAKNKQKALDAEADNTKAVPPKRNVRRSIIALVADFHPKTKRTERTKALGGLGAKFLGVPDGPFSQITLVNNSVRPNLSYTCILPEKLDLPKSAKSKIVMAEIEGRGTGQHAIWLVTDIHLV